MLFFFLLCTSPALYLEKNPSKHKAFISLKSICIQKSKTKAQSAQRTLSSHKALSREVHVLGCDFVALCIYHSIKQISSLSLWLLF